MTDWAKYRAEFPALASQAYLNTAAGAPMSRAAGTAGREYYEATVRDGDVHWDDWLARVELVRAQAAPLVGGSSQQIAFVQNCSAAMNLVAAELGGDGEVVLVRGDFPSVTYPWMVGGYDVKFVEPDIHGGADIEALAAACTDRTRAISVGWVQYRTGFRYDLNALSAICKKRGIKLVVDTTQGLGAVQFDAESLGVDYMVCSGYKWLTAGYGMGLLYAREPLDRTRRAAAGWRSSSDPYALISDDMNLSEDAPALELGHPPFAAVFALGAALEMQSEIGALAIETRVLHLSARLRQALSDAGLGVLPLSETDLRSGIVYAEAEADSTALRNELLDRGVYVSARGDGLRCSTHFYNDESDLAKLTEAFATLS
ncbi:MAG: aminotransferase class V-fold PLP-dependent enzyme [Acidobacteria bacterium]|nr:aminotransferase class V-fold PLP-dependent enzyme [Acidobacteriota bacterium]